MVEASVRQAAPGDVPNVAPLFDAYRQFYDMPPDLPKAQRYLEARLSSGESVIFLAENAAQQVIGFCQLYSSFCSVFTAPIWILNDLFVIPAFRGLGVGKLLLARAEDHAAAAGAVRITLQTGNTNIRAQIMYERAGWRRTTTLHAYSKWFSSGGT